MSKLNVEQSVTYRRLDQLIDELAVVLSALGWTAEGDLTDIEQSLRARMRDDDRPLPPMPTPPRART
jgi:hypothetical protein